MTVTITGMHGRPVKRELLDGVRLLEDTGIVRTRHFGRNQANLGISITNQGLAAIDYLIAAAATFLSRHSDDLEHARLTTSPAWNGERLGVG